MTSLSRQRLIQLALLTSFLAVNFIDKAVFGLAGTRIMADVVLTPAQFGLIGSSFFFLFSLSALVTGFIADRVRSIVVLGVLAAIWSVAQLPLAIPGAASFTLLLMSRIVLGLGEGPAYPMALHALYKWYPDDRRTVPGTILLQGANIGLAVAGPLITGVIAWRGWHAAYATITVLSIAWLGLWMLAGAEGSGQGRRTGRAPTGDDVGTWRVMTDPAVLLVTLVYFACYASIALYFTWFPAYLNLGLRFSSTATGWLFGAISLGSVAINISIARWSAGMTARGVPSRLARALVCTVGVLIAGLCFAAASLDVPGPAKAVLVAAGGLAGQMIFSFGPLIVGEIAPESRRGSALGMLSAIGTLGGVVAPYVMGRLIDLKGGNPAHGFEKGYLLLAAMLLPVGIVGAWLIDPDAAARRMARARGGPPHAAQGSKELSS